MKKTCCSVSRLLVWFTLCLAAAIFLFPVCTLADDAKTAAMANTTFEDVHVMALPKNTYGYRSMPGSMVALNDGRILMVYTRMDEQGHGDGSITARYSSDAGQSWGDEFILIPAPKVRAGDYYCLPSFLRLANGEILLSYIYVSSLKPLFGHNYYRRSNDDGQTWGDQLIVTPHKGYNIMHNDKLVQLANGRIIAPLEHQLVDRGDDHGGYVSYTFYSDDNGYSWWESDNMVNMLPVEAQEPHVVELKDGRLMMLMRTYNRYVARAYSEDNGKSWSKGKPVPELRLPANSSALDIKRIPATGDLLLVRAVDSPESVPGRRTPFASVISKDEGKTWVHERLIAADPEDDYGYPSLLFLDDLALISYHWRDGLHVARIGIGWFYEGW
ncbi:MAG TPA: sialidase family protein [Candidatus Bathyarchaeia archaeon]|nr:sialidase family protein [Candidatus Bathyarchaeia archaeon]